MSHSSRKQKLSWDFESNHENSKKNLIKLLFQSVKSHANFDFKYKNEGK